MMRSVIKRDAFMDERKAVHAVAAMTPRLCGSRLQTRIAAGTVAILAGSMLSGCLGSEPTQPRPVAYECTDAGQRDAHALAATLGAPSPTTKAFDLCLTRWDIRPLFGQLAGVRIDPFLTDATLGEAEATVAERFTCAIPVHPPNMRRGTAASLDCTIGDVRAEVNILREGRHVSANVFPRK